jgi:small subunit ribosomal protein S6
MLGTNREATQSSQHALPLPTASCPATLYILRTDLPYQEADAAIAKYQDFLVQQESEDITIQHRGRRRLAYDIKGHREGIYIQVNYTATPKTIESLERSMRLADDVIRYMTIKLEPEAVEAEDAEAIIPDAEEPVTTADVAVADVAVAAAE